MSSSQDSEVSSQGCAAEVFHPATGWCQRSGERPISRQNESERAGILLNGLLAKQAQLWSAGAICTSSALKAETECLLAERVRMGVQAVKIICIQTASPMGKKESYLVLFCECYFAIKMLALIDILKAWLYIMPYNCLKPVLFHTLWGSWAALGTWAIYKLQYCTL